MSENGRYYGKYRGTVFDNIDPEQRGRIQAMVPDVLGLTPSTYALPCVPIAGKQSGTFVVPEVGAGVWIEFEQGDPDYPIWTGCFWGLVAEVPALALTAQPPSGAVVVQTTLQNTLMISDMPGPAGGILLKTAAGAMIAINDVGITISNGQGATIVLAGNAVTINEGALMVT